jgi:Protein of unknown function (DUF3761)
MRHLWHVLIFLVLFLVPTSGSMLAEGQTTGRNLYDCLHGYPSCDSSQLSESEKARVEQAARQRNLYDCLHGYPDCTQSKLTDAERSQVAQAAHQRNFYNCLHGYPDCSSSKLIDSERPQIEQAAHQRNLYNCLHGYPDCSQSKLTEAERPQVEQAAHQRNLYNCLHGYPDCSQSKLTEAERPQVAQAAHRRNLYDCQHGYPGCVPGSLSEDEKSKLKSSSTAAAGPGSTSAIPQNPPHYYTNKDGIRVQSPTYYNSQPAGATAQCADGTFSFSLNHRGTCSHHGGVSRWLDKAPISNPVQPGPPRHTYAGYACISDCSGHAAGYKWAMEHDIDDAADCDTAGDRSNSPSFAEGCRAFVEGSTPQSDDTGAMDDDEPAESDEPETKTFATFGIGF